jgi:hypothetical protein
VALAPLLATVPGVAQTVSDPAHLSRYDAHLPLLSLPRVLGTTLDAIPADVPYVTVAAERRAAARKLLEVSPRRLNVGIVWTGNPANPSNRIRSAPLDALDPLFEVEGIDWYSLQQRRTSAEFSAAARAARLRPLPADWALVDTAALIAELDLVISVCTSIAHLSGALGRPTWTMLACAADWRWLQQRADSPWYPTMRLFRQPSPRDWSAVARAVAFELHALVSALTDIER